MPPKAAWANRQKHYAKNVSRSLISLATSHLPLARPGQSVFLNAECDRLEIHYLQQPGGGRLALYDYDQRLDARIPILLPGGAFELCTLKVSVLLEPLLRLGDLQWIRARRQHLAEQRIRIQGHRRHQIIQLLWRH